MKPNFSKSNFFVICVALLLIVGAILIYWFVPHWQWKAIPLHSLVEGLGGLVALSLSGLLFFLLKNKKIPFYYVPVSLGFVGTGIFDLFHASVSPGDAFVWLHSFAMFFGGLISVFIWLPERIWSPRYLKPLTIAVLFFAIALSVLTICFPQLLPAAAKDGVFTPPVVYLNIISGFLFLAVAGRLFIGSKSGSFRYDFLFAVFFLLNGFSGILFKFSGVWSPEWWFLHMMRLGAYFVVGFFFFLVYQRTIEEIETEKKRSASFLETIADGVIELNIDGTHAFVNQSAARMLGYAPEELIGQKSHPLWHHTKKDGRPYPREECPIYSSFINKKIVTGDGEIFWRKDKTSFPVEFTASPIFRGNEITGTLLIFRDISQRKKLEQELEQKVRERTKEVEESEIEIKKALELSEQTNKIMVGRELEMIKLKERIKILEKSNKN